MNLLKRFLTKYAFTLMELMVVVIVIGIIAALAIPSYRMAVDRAHEKDILVNLKLLAAAQEAYRARFDNYYPGDGQGNKGISQINSTLKLNIVPGNDVYTCSGNVGTYQCFAQHRDSTGSLKWTMTFRHDWVGNVGIETVGGCCYVQPCPTAGSCPP